MLSSPGIVDDTHYEHPIERCEILYISLLSRFGGAVIQWQAPHRHSGDVPTSAFGALRSTASKLLSSQPYEAALRKPLGDILAQGTCCSSSDDLRNHSAYGSF